MDWVGSGLDWAGLALGFSGLDWVSAGLELTLGRVHAIIFELLSLSIGTIGTFLYALWLEHASVTMVTNDCG